MNKEENKLLKCKLCEQEFPVLTTHIYRTHNMSTDDYLKRFPGSKLTSDWHRKKLSKASKKRFIDNPNLRKIVATRTFDFIGNSDLRNLLQRDYLTAKHV